MPSKMKKEDSRKKEIIEGALKAILQKGFNNITIQDISETAGFSKGVTMYYYKTKEDVVFDVVGSLLDSMLQQLKKEVDTQNGCINKLRAFVECIFKDPIKDKETFSIYYDFVGLSFRNQNIKKLFEEYFENLKKIAKNIAKDGRMEGIFKSYDMNEISMSIISLVNGFMIQWLFDKEDNSFLKYKNSCLSMLTALLMR